MYGEEWFFTGPNSKNNAKLKAQQERKRVGAEYTVEFMPKHHSYRREDGFVVILTATPETLKRLEAERNEYWEREREEAEYRRPFSWGIPQNTKKKRRFRKFFVIDCEEPELPDDLSTPRQGAAVHEGMKKRLRANRSPGSPPTRLYHYGNGRWGGHGKKADRRNWKRKRKNQYVIG